MVVGVKIGWLDATHHCVVCRLSEWRDWTQLRESMALYQQTAAAYQPQPDLIYHFCDGAKVPQPWSMPQLRAFMLQNSPGTHRTVFVNAPRVLKVFVRMTQQAYTDLAAVDNEYMFVDTMDEAKARLGMQAADPAHQG